MKNLIQKQKAAIFFFGPLLFTLFLYSDGFSQTGSISGNVTGGGAPLEGFVKVVSQSANIDTMVPIVSGAYVISNLPDGYYSIYIPLPLRFSRNIFLSNLLVCYFFIFK